MKNLKNFTDVSVVSKYALLLIFFLAFNNLENDIYPYSCAVLVSALSLGASVISAPILYISSFLILGEVGLLGQAAASSVILSLITAIYSKCQVKIKYETPLYTLIAMLPFIFLGNTYIQISLEKRIFTAILTIILTLITTISARAVKEKGLKFKLGFEEIAAVTVGVACFGLGISHLTSPLLFKGLSVLVILIACYVYKTGIATVISCILGIGLSLYYRNVNYVAIFLVWSVFAQSFTELSRFVAAISVMVCDYAMQLIFNVYNGYLLSDFLSVLCPVAVYCLIPTKFLKRLKERLYSFREKQLVRQTINRNRLVLSGKLYDLSGVFAEMANAFNLFKHNQITEDKAKEIMEKQIVCTVCKDCENAIKCRRAEKYVSDGIIKMIDIGFAKGKLTLIDMPKELTSHCVRPNNILYGLNKLLADYRTGLIERTNLDNGRTLIAEEALGVAEILRTLALESSTTLKYHSRLERALSDGLFKSGFSITELLVFGDEDNLSVSLITVMKEFSELKLASVISGVLGMDMEVYEKTLITEEKCYLSFRKATEYDAVFGIAKRTKDGSQKSGDTHSVTRLTGNKFLVALSDGMGSGESAENISSASLSLIESFYKAGMPDKLILNTVNKLLSINTEDSFTALDISVIDLNSCSADFIKYGSPYGFILNDNGIKIVEGNSLPLGILDELKPSVATTELEGGDMILLLTDGISDAFGSSGEIIDYLRTVPAKNPQTLADGILEYALKLNGGEKKDDMTALAVRVFKRAG
ncbi:MAG: SpoIIE family protein phosphatase [Clostridia bacterium]|nr:SpoIIE family protein phosphatase [Clostridia bacterium]